MNHNKENIRIKNDRNSLNSASERIPSARVFSTTYIISMLCVTAIFLNMFVSNVNAQTDQKTCIPSAYGVPALPGAPNWWNTTLKYPYYYNMTDDPRWRGAVSHTYGGNQSEDVTFRALYDSQNNLYLSWRIDVDPSFDVNQDLLYVGISPGGSSQDVIVKITPYGFNTPLVAGKPYKIRVLIRNTTTGSWDPQSAIPKWLMDNNYNFTGVWFDNVSSHYNWAVQMKVPKNSSIDSGINFGTNFRMWYEVQVMTPGGPTAYDWPRTTPTFQIYPDISTWGNFSLGAGGPGCGEGVSISANNIGTYNTPSSQIQLNQTNTFFARPFNNMSNKINSSSIYARFRIANWGSRPDWNNVSDPSQLWSDIRGGSKVPNTLNISPGTFGEIQFDWTPNNTEKAPFQSGDRRLHQCMLVELSGPNLTFVTNSVYRNMDFVHASNFSREAEISVVGLPALVAGKRDAYLYVQTRNMPSYIKPEPMPPNQTIWDERSTNSSLPFTWNASNFRGFDVDGTGTETLELFQTNLGTGEEKTRTIGSSKLSYESTRQIKEFEVSRNKGISIDYALDSSGNPAYHYGGNYYAQLNLFGEPNVAINGDARSLSRLILEQNASEEKILSTGEGWNIGEGWMLTVKSTQPVDYRTAVATSTPVPTTTPSQPPLNQVTLELSKDGKVLDTRNVPEGKVYTYLEQQEIQVPAFITYIDNVTVGKTTNTVKLKYTWAISLDMLDFYIPQDMKARYGKEIGVLKFTSATRDHLYAENFKDISLIPKNIIPLANNLNFKVINDQKYLRFYPILKKSETLEEMPAYRVFYYYDSGRKTIIDGVSYAILDRGDSFGYYVRTDEDVGGWKTALQGAQLIAPNFYKVGVPNNGSVVINTMIETLEPGATPGPGDTPVDEDNPPPWWPFPWWPVPWWFWLLLLIILIAVILLRRHQP